MSQARGFKLNTGSRKEWQFGTAGPGTSRRRGRPNCSGLSRVSFDVGWMPRGRASEQVLRLAGLGWFGQPGRESRVPAIRVHYRRGRIIWDPACIAGRFLARRETAHVSLSEVRVRVGAPQAGPRELSENPRPGMLLVLVAAVVVGSAT